MLERSVHVGQATKWETKNVYKRQDKHPKNTIQALDKTKTELSHLQPSSSGLSL